MLERRQQAVRNQKIASLYEDSGGAWVAFENKPIVYNVVRLVLTKPIGNLTLQGENGFSETQKIIQNTTALSLYPLFSDYYQLLLSTSYQCYLICLLVSPRMVFLPQILQQQNMWANTQCPNFPYKFIQIFFAMNEAAKV
ncbi:hypothetical protein [Rodentibacter trehalosifermentans]|uniref:hypothetical protein n=1 Tax=Rodentibacter trehalosifermentans TaxID=1908263 RepID=UPI001055F8D0|nr:hypothetical protein [Rodentibacter trehalosifermentans]